MAFAFDLTQAIMDDAERRGVPITREQAAAEAARASLGRTPPAESRTDGAPEVDLSDLTPQSYYDSMNRRGRQLENGGPSNPLPGQPGWTEDSEILAYEPGMTDAEYAAAKANRMHRERMLRGTGPDPGGYTEFNSQQPMWLGTADDQQRWRDWVAEDPTRMQRYDPEGFAARQAEQEDAFVQKHYKMLQDKYGYTEAEQWLKNRASGEPVDYSITRSPMERAQVQARSILEGQARGLGPVPNVDPSEVTDKDGNPIADPTALETMQFISRRARAELQRQEAASGYSGAMGNDGNAAGAGPDGDPETKGARFSRKTKERQAELDARKLALRNQRMLAGDNPANNMANAYTLMGDPFNDGLTENQQRALEYMLPSGKLAAEVDARNMEEAAGLAARGLQSVLLPSIMGNTQAAGGAGSPEGRRDVEQGANGTWRTPAGVRYLVEMSDLFESPEKMAEFLVNNYGYTPGEAELASQKAKAERYLPWGM